jgi:transcriptional regulator with XRE-family HTH domain
MNPTKRLREALKMSQQQFATDLGISVGSVRAYERGVHVSDASLEAMKTLAASRGFGDLAMEMAGGKFTVGKVITPAAKGKSIRLRRASHGTDMSDELHAAVDAILNSGLPDAIGAMEYFLRSTKEQVELAPKRNRK